MKITLHQLQVFAKVAELGSVTKAANSLHMTQPAVSNIIKQLEDYYACKLIEVIGRKLSLTQFGEIVMNGCLQCDSTLNNTLSEIELLKGALIGKLTVATVSTAKYFLPQLLGTFKDMHQDIHMKLTVCNRGEILDRLQDNCDDFVIMSHPPRTQQVECTEFYDDELTIVCSPDHPLLSKKAIPLSKLQNESWIMREEGSGTRYASENIFKKHRFTPNIEMEIGDVEAIKQAIMANMGISLISKHSVKIECENNLLKELPVKGFPVKHQWYLVKNKGKQLSPIGQQFYQFVNHSNELIN